MEKGINQYFLEKFGMKQADIRSYSPLTLAYIGDGIYDLVIRSMMVAKGNAHVNDLHRRTSKLVKAHAQSELIGLLQPELTEEELAVYRRGRNAKSFTMAKNATVADYRRATGFEALMGYLYLEDQMDRMMELILTGLKKLKEKGKNTEIKAAGNEQMIAKRDRDEIRGIND
ncbi:mini-ribonuclease 3 [Lachnospiraceae bacterium]|nr:mini-ribonuclease 3 [Lachnospiraceae bacterium]